MVTGFFNSLERFQACKTSKEALTKLSLNTVTPVLGLCFNTKHPEHLLNVPTRTENVILTTTVFFYVIAANGVIKTPLSFLIVSFLL